VGPLFEKLAVRTIKFSLNWSLPKDCAHVFW
jgi:hypothetical protein